MNNEHNRKGRGLLASFLHTLFGRDKGTNDMETFVVVGLGNPGTKYAHTRHNVGFDVMEMIEKRVGSLNWRSRLNGEVAEINRGDKRVVFCRPQTFMNASGDCVAELIRWYKIDMDHLVVIYDDIDLPAAKLRVRKSGSAGTHNGMRSIVSVTPNTNFPRIRVGVGKCPPDWQLVDWVLSHYLSRDEQDAMNAAFTKAAECVDDWIDHGIEHAMQSFNGK